MTRRKRPTAAEEAYALASAVGLDRALELTAAVAKRPVGRPRTVGADGHLHVRVPVAALERWRAAAARKGDSLTEWVIRALDRAAK